MAECLSLNRLAEYVEGGASATANADILEHIAACMGCLQLVVETLISISPRLPSDPGP